ncbi:MAG: hypothetical protein IKL79_04325 [Clostridia bacterium]|nr:hypothetical protein [Clostridia bacterium]MBR3681211.1 hypothetical protein [Clostridia bacterium]
MEQIYMIPVTEAFEATAGKPECGCPLCRLYKKLQEDELDIILGASMMEPDIRIKTNEQGFCLTHYNMMLGRRRMLGMGLMMESHLAEVEKKLRGPAVLGDRRASALNALGRLECDCYVCGRIEKNLAAMVSTAVLLWDSDYNGFRKLFEKQPWFCMPHYRAMLEYASKKLSKKSYHPFYDAAYAIQERYLKELSGDVSWFCKKFDYRYDEEPWYNSKDSVKRAIRFLGGSFGEEDNGK